MGEKGGKADKGKRKTKPRKNLNNFYNSPKKFLGYF
jgi:hypothetical protein